MYSIEEIQEFINRIEAGEFTLPEEVLSIEGYSSRKIKQLLNHLCSKPDTIYLEIGLYVGSTFIPALYNNPIKAAIGIDNWTLPEWFSFGKGRDDLEKNLLTHVPKIPIRIIDADCFTVDLDKLPHGVNVYFYDGDHCRQAQYDAIAYFAPILADEFILIIDDFNWAEPREETYHALKDLGYKIVHEWVLLSVGDRDTERWWNGLFVGMIRKR